MKKSVYAFALYAFCLFSLHAQTVEQLLRQAEGIKSSDAAQFSSLLETLDNRRQELNPQQQDFYTYLDAYYDIIKGNYQQAISKHTELVDKSNYPNIQYRAAYSLANTFGIQRNFVQGLEYVNRFDEIAPMVSEPAILIDGNVLKSVFYQEAEQYELALETALLLMEQSIPPRSECLARSVLVESSFNLEGKAASLSLFETSEQLCRDINENLIGSFISINKANLLEARGLVGEALTALDSIEQIVVNTRYPRLLAQYYAVRAQTLMGLGDLASAKINATRTLQYSEQAKYNKPAVAAYRILADIEERNANFEQALAYHQDYVLAENAYADEKQNNLLTFQRARFEAQLNEKALALISKENELLAAENKTAKQEAQNSILVAMFSTASLAVAFVWLYRTNKTKQKFKVMAQKDGLTGLANRSEFCRLADNALYFCKKNQQPLSLVIFDLDHFKSINDTYGHAIGDVVLQLVAGVLKQECRQNDIIGRLGGEEFGVVLPSCSATKAFDIADHLRRKLMAIDTTSTGHDFTVSASFGVAQNTIGNANYQTLFTQSDEALYRSKREGRNRVYLAQAMS